MNGLTSNLTSLAGPQLKPKRKSPKIFFCASTNMDIYSPTNSNNFIVPNATNFLQIVSLKELVQIAILMVPNLIFNLILNLIFNLIFEFDRVDGCGGCATASFVVRKENMKFKMKEN